MMFVTDNTVSYNIGDFVFTRDGRNGQIVRSVFDDEGDIEFFQLDSTGIQLFRGADLSVFAPGEESPFVSAPLLPGEIVPDIITGAFLTQAIFALRQDLLAQIDVVQGVDRETVADMIAAGLDIIRGPLEVATADVRAEQVAVHQAQADVFVNLESLITTGLSEIGARLDALDQLAREAAGVSLFDLLGQVGTLLKDPLAFVLERGADVIQQEVLDGLNR